MIGSFPGAITSAEYQSIQNKPSGELSSYECIVQGVSAAAFKPFSMIRARECLDPLVNREPGNAYAWAALAVILTISTNWGFGPPADQRAIWTSGISQ